MKKITALTDATLNYLKVNNIMAWANATMGVYDTKIGGYRKMRNASKGAPDVLALDTGQLIGIELKTVDRMKPEQVLFMIEMIIHGGYFCIVKSIDDLLESLRFWGYVISENGVMNRSAGTCGARINSLPNANLIPQLKPVECPQWLNTTDISLLQSILGKYYERITC